MAIKIGDFFEEAGVPGVIAGIGAVVLAPVLIPAVAGIGKPLAKAAIKGGLVLYEKSKGALSEVNESFEDLVAEARMELSESQHQSVGESTLSAHSEEMLPENGGA
ncbi:MAG: DUF5132 domain-containing protein [Chroococcidiopsidaceae cyanobacterium CP_BM_ER_R8_30]|nr:DUF5132 domain-containing protein [Chroococcidiopsidaceae cyanobacterium CP_BM_ER_R8_30]